MKRFRFVIRFFTLFLLSTAFCSFTAFAHHKNTKSNCVKCLSISPVAGLDAITVGTGFKHNTSVTINLLSEDKTVIKSFSTTVKKSSRSIKIEGIFDLPEGPYTINITDHRSGKTYSQPFYKM